jgi:hypothetical protein
MNNSTITKNKVFRSNGLTLNKVWVSLIRPALKVFLFLITILVFCAFAQFAQLNYSHYDVRQHLLFEYIGDNPQRMELLNSFQNCSKVENEKRKDLSFKENVNLPVVISQCLDVVGDDKFRDVYLKADTVVVTPSWPLSYFLNQLND